MGSMMFRIHDRSGVREVTLDQDVIKVGTLLSSHVRVNDVNVSRMHAVIERPKPGEIYAIDLGSATGTVVDGKRVAKGRVYDGSTIQVGETLIQVSASEAPRPAAEAIDHLSVAGLDKAVFQHANFLRGFAAFFDEKMVWSEKTFGPRDRYNGLIAHIRKELVEIEAKPNDLEEWVDVVLLAMDGAWRSAGADGAAFVQALLLKQVKNVSRSWPDWRTLKPDQVLEHVREPVEAQQPAETGDAALRRDLEAARSERNELVAELKETKTRLSEMEKQLDGVHVAVGQLGRDISSKDAFVASLQQQISALTRIVEQKSSALTDAQAEIERLRVSPAGQEDRLRQELASTAKLLETANRELAAERSETRPRLERLSGVEGKFRETWKVANALARAAGVAASFMFAGKFEPPSLVTEHALKLQKAGQETLAFLERNPL